MSIPQHQSRPQPRLDPPALYPLPHPNQSLEQQRQAQLRAYNARNHGKFHERNRGSKKAGFAGMWQLVCKLLGCGSDVSEAIS